MNVFVLVEWIFYVISVPLSIHQQLHRLPKILNCFSPSSSLGVLYVGEVVPKGPPSNPVNIIICTQTTHRKQLMYSFRYYTHFHLCTPTGPGPLNRVASIASLLKESVLRAVAFNKYKIHTTNTHLDDPNPSKAQCTPLYSIDSVHIMRFVDGQ